MCIGQPEAALRNRRPQQATDVLHEVRGLDRRLFRGLQTERRCARGAKRARRDVIHVEHHLQHLVPPLQRQLRRCVVDLGAADDACEVRRLRKRQLGRRLGEVRLRRGFDAVRAAAEVDRVEIVIEDLLFRELVLEPHREERFSQLSVHRARGPDLLERIARVLLCDRRAALQRVPRAHVGRERAHDPTDADGAVLEEAAVLGRDHRLADRQRHPLP